MVYKKVLLEVYVYVAHAELWCVERYGRVLRS